MDTPLVLLDVDGVLNPAQRSAGYQRYRASPYGEVLRLLLNPAHGPMLTELAAVTGAELVWASYWNDAANAWIGSRIGLPELRNVPVPPRDAAYSYGAWKARQVAAWVGARPFVWLEDEPDVRDTLARSGTLGPYLIVPVDPERGLSDGDVETARRWLDGLATGDGAGGHGAAGHPAARDGTAQGTGPG